MADTYSIINPWRYGIGEDEVARRLGYIYREGDDGPGGWYTQSQNNEGAMDWSRVRTGDNEGGEGTSSLPSFSDAFDPREAQRQTLFLSNVVPAIQNTRPDIWKAYEKAYGDQATAKLYVDLGEGFGGSNVYREPESAERQLKQFISGPFQLFNDAYSKPSHFMVRPGSGYLPMNQEDFSGFSADSLGLFLDENGQPIIGGVASKPAEHGLGAIAGMMPIVLGSIVLGGGLGGLFNSMTAGGAAATEALAAELAGLGLSTSDLAAGVGMTIEELAASMGTTVEALTGAGAGEVGGVLAGAGNIPGSVPSWISDMWLPGNVTDTVAGYSGTLLDSFNTAIQNGLTNGFPTFNFADAASLPDWLQNAVTDNGLDATKNWWDDLLNKLKDPKTVGDLLKAGTGALTGSAEGGGGLPSAPSGGGGGGMTGMTIPEYLPEIVRTGAIPSLGQLLG